MSFKQATLEGGRQPRTLEKAVAAGQAWNRGALLVMDANGQWAECGADPAAIGAVACNAYGANTTGFIRTGREEFPPGRMVAVLVQNNVRFRARYVGALPAAIGGVYGVIRDTDGLWKVDFNEVAATRVKLVSLDFTAAPLNRNEVVVQFLAANVQIL